MFYIAQKSTVTRGMESMINMQDITMTETLSS